MIVAPQQVIDVWEREATRAYQALKDLAAPGRAAALATAPKEVGEVVAYLGEVLSHAAGTLAASAVQATPGAPEAFRAGLAELAKQTAAMIERGVLLAPGEEGAVCPLPEQDGSPMRCGCPPDEVAKCAVLAQEIGAGTFTGAPAPAIESIAEPTEGEGR